MARRDFNNAMRALSPRGKREYAYSGRAQTREIPGLYAEQAARRSANAFNPGGGSAGGTTPAALAPGAGGGVSGAAPADTGLEGYFAEEPDFFYQEDYGYRPRNFDARDYSAGDGGRGQDGPPDIFGSRAQSPLSDLDKDVLTALGQVPGVSLAANIARAADYMGLSGVLDDPNPTTAYGRPGTLGFKGYINQRHAQEIISRHRRNAQEIAEGERDSIGDYDVGGGAFDDPGGSFDRGYDQPAAPAPSPAVGGYSVGGYSVGGGLSYDGPTGSSFDRDDGGNDSGGRGSPEGGSGGHGGQAGEGAGSGNSADGGRGDSPGYHEGGYVSEDLIPGELRGDVPATLQEHEQVLTADATDLLGPGFAEGVNMMASLLKRRAGQMG